MTEFDLFPVWPIVVGAAILIAAFVSWACCAISASHRPTRMIGVTFCEDCAVTCDEAYPCFCCREGRVLLKEQT